MFILNWHIINVAISGAPVTFLYTKLLTILRPPDLLPKLVRANTHEWFLDLINFHHLTVLRKPGTEPSTKG